MKAIIKSKDTELGEHTLYSSIHDPGVYRERELYIEDDEGNCVVLKNEQIGELWTIIKPSGR